jgi:ubiquinone/menaquinone biosynthesis C-methylase UbiE
MVLLGGIHMPDNKNVFKENSRKNFDKQAEHYDQSSDGRFVSKMYDKVVEMLNGFQGGILLEAGCGTGNILSRLYKYKKFQLCGLDISDKMIQVARRDLPQDVLLKVGDAEFIPWPEDYFDIVLCNASFHHYPNPEKVLLEMKRVLKPAGKLVIGDPTAPPLIRQVLNFMLHICNNGDYRIYSPKEMKKLLKTCGFKPFKFRKINYKSFVISASA